MGRFVLWRYGLPGEKYIEAGRMTKHEAASMNLVIHCALIICNITHNGRFAVSANNYVV